MVVGERAFQHYLLGLMAVANNISALPLYLELIKGRPQDEQEKLCRVATLTAFLTMMVSMVAGIAVLNFFDISLPAFRIAGGLLLINAGFSMMGPADASDEEQTPKQYSQLISTAVIPIGIPLTTGALCRPLSCSPKPNHQWMHEWKLLAAILVMTLVIL